MNNGNNGMEVVVQAGGGIIPQSGLEMDYLPAVASQIAIQRRDMVLDFYRNVMVPDVDYGKIPGTPKPTLLKPGAEKLCTYFGYAPQYETISSIERWGEDGREPMFHYRLKCKLYKQGRFVGEGEGSCSSWESKYRYRWVNENELPPGLNREKLQVRGGAKKCRESDYFLEKAELNPKYGKTEAYWQEFRDQIEAGTARRVKVTIKNVERDGWEISVDETQYRIPNPDIFDQVNTILKMAMKRAQIAATLTTTSASEFFTQDLEDMEARGIDTGGHPVGTQAAADAVRDRKLAQAQQQQAPPPAATAPPKAEKPFNIKEMLQAFAGMKSAIGDEHYYRVLGQHGITHANEIKTKPMATKVWKDMELIVKALADEKKAKEAAEAAALSAAESDEREDWIPEFPEPSDAYGGHGQ